MIDELDLRVDLNTEDDTGLPWAFLRDASDPAIVVEGAWLVVGSGKVRAVAQVAQIEEGLVWVRPCPARSASTATSSVTAAPPDTKKPQPGCYRRREGRQRHRAGRGVVGALGDNAVCLLRHVRASDGWWVPMFDR